MSAAKRRRQSGMTLVEVLIAMMILAGGLLTMAGVQIYSMQGGQRGRHLATAANIAASQIERLQRTTWTNIPPTTGWTSVVNADSILQRADADQVYEVEWRIFNLIPNTSRSIDVRVRWEDATGRRRSVTMSTIRHNHEAI